MRDWINHRHQGAGIGYWVLGNGFFVSWWLVDRRLQVAGIEVADREHDDVVGWGVGGEGGGGFGGGDAAELGGGGGGEFGSGPDVVVVLADVGRFDVVDVAIGVGDVLAVALVVAG